MIGYILEMQESGAEEWTKTHEKTLRTSEHVVPALSSSKKYCFRVAGININGTGDFSEACVETEPVERIGRSPLFNNTSVIVNTRITCGYYYSDQSHNSYSLKLLTNALRR